MVLVDQAGRILLQERDSHAPVAPDQWSLVGGAVEPGEPVEAAAYRELQEETGLRPERPLQSWMETILHIEGRPEPVRYHVWIASTEATDADIVVGEGRQIRFVSPNELSSLDVGGLAAHVLPALLRSKDYQHLSGVCG